MNWAVVGSGVIATQFINDIKLSKQGKVIGLYSRNIEKTKMYGQKHGVSKVYQSFEELLQDDEIENVYIAVPNSLHKEYVLKAANAKKNILCEKPMAINVAEAKEMIACAVQNNVLLMEGMWTRFFPAMDKLREWIHDGTLGKINSAEFPLGYNAIRAGEKTTWRFNSTNGYGALMDMGVYSVHLALDIMGGKAPVNIQGSAHIVDGIDYYNAFILKYDDTIITASSSVVNDTDLTAKLYCENGEVIIDKSWWFPRKITFRPLRGEEVVFEYPRTEREEDGLWYEIDAFEQTAQDGEKQVALSSHDNSIKASTIMCELRKQWGLIYPQD